MALSSSQPRLKIEVELVKYLQDVLGIAAEIVPWAQDKKAPYYLREAYDFRELTLLNQRVILAIRRGRKNPSLLEVRKQLDVLAKLAGLPAALVTPVLASYERKRLVSQHVAFIVPGNQLYLPGLGMDLREYFRSQAELADGDAISPSTQAMLLTALLRTPWHSEFNPTAMASKLGYTAMTASRAMKELTESGIGTLRRDGRNRRVDLGGQPAETWERAKPLLRSPVKRIAWAKPNVTLTESAWPTAGMTALAEHSMLAEPSYPVRAISSDEWAKAMRAKTEVFPERVPGAIEWQIWTYQPRLLPNRKTVDPLSLTLSLQGDADERVQLALDELKEQFPW
jgi:DNA-binding transcriptional ArsR family regulator